MFRPQRQHSLPPLLPSSVVVALPAVMATVPAVVRAARVAAATKLPPRKVLS